VDAHRKRYRELRLLPRREVADRAAVLHGDRAAVVDAGREQARRELDAIQHVVQQLLDLPPEGLVDPKRIQSIVDFIDRGAGTLCTKNLFFEIGYILLFLEFDALIENFPERKQRSIRILEMPNRSKTFGFTNPGFHPPNFLIELLASPG